MAESAKATPGTMVRSLAEHLQAFHRGLPPAEQALLEQVLALAQRAQGDVQAYAASSPDVAQLFSFVQGQQSSPGTTSSEPSLLPGKMKSGTISL